MIVKRLWLKLSLKRKVIILFSILSLIPVLIVSVFSSGITNQYVHELVLTNVKQTTGTISSSLDQMFSEATSFFSLQQNLHLVNFLNSMDENDRYRNALALGSAYKDFRNANNVNSYVKDITILGSNHFVYSERDGAATLEVDLESIPIFSDVIQQPSQIHVLMNPYTHNEFRSLESEVALTLGLLKLGTTELYGILQISIDSDYIYDSLNDPRIPPGGGVLISDMNDHILFTDQAEHDKSTDQLMFKDSKVMLDDGITIANDNLLHASTMSSTGWNVIVSIPQSYLDEPADKINIVTVLGIILALLLIVVSLIVINAIVVTPTRKISRYMNEAAAGKLVTTGGHPGQDEIATLFNNYDVMINNIKALLQRIVEQQESVRQTELRVLQEQINPHFLYNSLDSVIWAAESENYEQVAKLTLSLSNFYRAVLAGGLNIVTLENEFKLVQSFLEVMHMRYQDILEFQIMLDPKAANLLFPKVILEPIVENAIYHGIKQKRWKNGNKGLITVTAVINEQSILDIKVIDNGIGMNQQQLIELKKSLAHEKLEQHNSYGLWNVNQRLKLFFGEHYSIHIESKPNKGTVISLNIKEAKENNSA